MPRFICVTCGTQYPASPEPPAACPICLDERQYIGWGGQRWTTLEALQADHTNTLRLEEPGLTGIGTQPALAIGQRALLVQSPGGNVLWDCITLIDADTAAAVRTLGGLAAIAISHPHFYSSMVEWSHAFGGVPIYLHAADRAHVMRPDRVIRFWEGETCVLWDGLTLVRCGGHFEGSSVLYWPAGAEGRGALLAGDTLMVASDRRSVSVMYSYPNYIPLNARTVARVVAAVRPFAFDRIYSGWTDRTLAADAQAAVARSEARYRQSIAPEPTSGPA